ncbi:arginyltransferase [Psychrobacter sp. I-STPA6b]|uniref:arginyltransferase n=1 Tax=Psychrobacter sp. I-STPA6b TaxID=2585718 RepID=UPI001D0CA918|nr:arginyltransferase [Psychrobacter sp. I-STPA6b]
MTVHHARNVDSTFFQTSPLHLCSYLPDRAARLSYVAIDTHDHIENSLYSHLVEQGYRRSGDIIYRPECMHCRQCIPTRIPLQHFKMSRRFRKVLKRNPDVITNTIPSSHATSEHFSLYGTYITERHADGDMYPPSLHTFEKFLCHSITDTFFIEFRESSGQLIAVAVTDRLNNGLSSVYTFFETQMTYQQRSLGIYSILQQIELAKALQLQYLYLGYWIPSVKKMRYKADFYPIELFINQQWQYFEQTPDSDTILEILNTTPIKNKTQSKNMSD